MAASAQDVKNITGSTLPDASIDVFLTVAACILDSLDKTLDCYDEAHAYLAAHLLELSPLGDEILREESESIRGKYTVKMALPMAKGSGVLSTNFGTVANTLTGGCLSELDKRPFSFKSIGC